MKNKNLKQVENVKELSSKEMQIITGGQQYVYYKDKNGNWVITIV